MLKRKLLWISAFAPYDSVDHAGGKIHNFYLKGISGMGNYDVRLITFAKESELPKLDLMDYGINYSLGGTYLEQGDLSSRNVMGVVEKFVRWNIFDKYAGFVKPVISKGVRRQIVQLKKENYSPDIILLQWTNVVLLIDEIVHVFPNARIMAVEEDVSFLLYYRKYINESNGIKKALRKILYTRLKEKELLALNKSDLIVVNNQKDKKLLLDNNVEKKIFQLVPYYQSFIDNDYVGDEKVILMYGAMNRVENYSSVIWFIENVWNDFDQNDMKLVVIGARPNKKLQDYNSERIRIAGYVDDVGEYMKHAMCLVAPLILGAGIKIKVLEALSAGIPVLTNSIGVEGIGIQDGVHYIHCEKPDEYACTLKSLFKGEIDVEKISLNSKAFIKENYNLELAVPEFNNAIMSLE